MTQENELILDRLLDAPRDKVFRCWTDPELIKQWFAPKPYTTPVAKVDLKVGGSNMIVMKSPEGQEIPCPGTYLEIVPNEKLVFTDAYTGDWQPSGKPFMTVVLTFADEGGKTRYVARSRHWSKEDREAHEKMGFHQGWGICADQLGSLGQEPLKKRAMIAARNLMLRQAQHEEFSILTLSLSKGEERFAEETLL